MSLPEKFSKYIKDKNLFQKDDNLIIATSGGVDSVVLCELCYRYNFNFYLAYCNFQLRGEESERDENFVRSLSEKYQKPIFIKKFKTEEYATEHKVSIQVAARELRYKWFEELRKKVSGVRYGVSGVSSEQSAVSNQQSGMSSEQSAAGNHQSAMNSEQTTNLIETIIPLSGVRGLNTTVPLSGVRGFLLTAHHADDNIETLLMNFFKGTGIKGLKGILPKQNSIVRPLLFAKKEEILKFANENNVQFVEDSSNLSDKYTRNYFRNQLIPSLQKVFPQVEENLSGNIERFNEINILYQQSINEYKKKLIEPKGNEFHIPALKLLQCEPLHTIVYEIIKEFGFTAHQCDEVIHILKGATGKYISSPTHRIIKNRKWIIISPQENNNALHILINDDEKEIEFEQGILQFKKSEKSSFQMDTSQNTACLNADLISFPLLLRKWKQGDYFYPLGMQKKKKLSRFFIDTKMSVTEKEKIWVVESNKKIFWVVNKRIDNRFKINDTTKNVLYITLKEK